MCDPAKVSEPDKPHYGREEFDSSNQRGGLTSTPITTLDLTGYRGDACEKVCPGYNETKDRWQTCVAATAYAHGPARANAT